MLNQYRTDCFTSIGVLHDKQQLFAILNDFVQLDCKQKISNNLNKPCGRSLHTASDNENRCFKMCSTVSISLVSMLFFKYVEKIVQNMTYGSTQMWWRYETQGLNRISSKIYGKMTNHHFTFTTKPARPNWCSTLNLLKELLQQNGMVISTHSALLYFKAGEDSPVELRFH